MSDAERLLTGARRPLVLGIGGGGDVVGALATAEACRIYHGAEPLVGGVTWERRVIDPAPGPRSSDEIEGVRELAPGVLAAGGSARVRDSGVRFAEGRVAELLQEETVLVDVTRPPAELADSLRAAGGELGCDLFVFVDVGGDALARGDEDGLASPLCDAIMLAAATRLQGERDVLGGVFGIGCDGELAPAEVLARLSEVAAAGGLAGVRGLTPPVVERLERAVEAVPTEASAQALRCFRGETGTAEIRVAGAPSSSARWARPRSTSIPPRRCAPPPGWRGRSRTQRGWRTPTSGSTHSASPPSSTTSGLTTTADL